MTELEIRQHYRNAFSGSSGKVVFHDLMLRAGFFDEGAEFNDRRNMMVEIIKILGAFSEDPITASKAMCDALLSQPISRSTPEEE